MANAYKTSDLEEVLFEDDVVALTQFRRDVSSVKRGLARNSSYRTQNNRNGYRRTRDRDRGRVRDDRDRDRDRRQPPRRRLHDYVDKDGKPKCKRPGCKGSWDPFKGCSVASCTAPKPRQFDRDRGRRH